MAFDTFELNRFAWNMKKERVLRVFFWGDTHDCAEASDDEHIEDVRRSIRHGELHETTMDKLNKLLKDLHSWS